MGEFNKIFKIVFFPITIIFYLLKLGYRIIDKRITNEYLRSLSIEKIDSLNGIEFEKFLYLSFASLGIKVIRTKSSRDYGADLVLKRKNQTIVIQSKLYFNHNVGNSAVQEIATARTHYNADIGIVITNSFFTKSACYLAESNKVKLIDRFALENFLSSDKSEKLEIIDNWALNS